MKSILPLTATFTWSPSNYPSCEPLLASGTVAGALDENFSNDAQVQIWKPDYAGGRRGGNPQRLAGINTSARFNRLAWGYVNPNRPQGLLAAGLENGELNVWDASKLISSSDSSSSSLLRNTTHTGPIKGLDFNSINSHLLGSGGPSGEIYVWDLNSPAKPYSPGAKSSKLDEITSLQWNKQVPQVLATGSNSGYTVIWDLKSKKEVASLQFGGSQGGGPPGISLNGNGTAGRRIMGPVAWHPDTPTRIITASCDDHEDPVILQWDLRNWLTPESILRGHTAGILGLSWSQSDSDLLVSCGKDNRTIFWNPRLGSCIGELPSATNWCFEAQLSPKNQNLLAVASFDGKIGIHDLQNTNSEFRQDEEADKEAEAAAAAASAQNDEDDIFNLPSAAALTAAAAPATKGTSLAQPPKWLKRPVSATFGFGGQLVSTTNVPLASDAPVGKNKPKPVQSTQINVRDVVTEPEIVSRAKRLQEALENGTLADFCAEKARENEKGEGASNGPTTIGGRPDEGPNWKALSTLFHADSKDELIALLGFNKEDVKDKVSKAIEKFKLGTNAAATGMLEATTTGAAAKAAATSGSSVGGATAGSTAQSISSDGPVPQGGEPTVSFASEPSESVTTTTTEVSTDEIDGEAAKLSSATSTSAGAPSESETTEPSLFGEDVPGQPNEAHAAFFNSISGESGAGVRSALPERVLVPHNNIAPGSSVAATIGSPGPSSVGGGSETMTGLGGAKTDEGEHEGSITSVRPEATTFRIYPADESDADKLITRALVLGDFASAVSLCISTDRFADALLLAVRGGPDLLATTQKAYFEKRTTSLPYLRLFQSIVSDDLVDVVQNADLSEWEEIFVVLCTFAKGEEFANLVEQLGQRLEFKYKSARAAEKEGGSLNGHSEETNGTVVPLSVKAKTFREHAVLCYLGAGRLERVAALWIDEMREEEAALRASMASSISSGSETEASSLYSAHASALQTFMEKITVFQHASSYVDEDLANPTQSSEAAESGARSYKLAALYDRTHEYIELLADQGLIATALKYVDQTPQDYRVSRNGKQGIESAASTRERLVRADAARSNGRGVAAASVAPIAPASTASSSYGPTSTNAYGAPQSNYSQNAYGATSTYGVPSQQQYGSSQQNSSGYGAQPASVPSIPVIPPVPNVLDPYAQQPASANSAYGPSDPYSSTPSPYAPSGNAGSAYGAPPQGSIASSSTPTAATLPPPPPAKKEPVSGWNDVPDLQPIRRTTSAMGNKAAPITSPFPNSSAAASPSPYNTGLPPSQGSLPPPPPRGPTPGGVTAGGAAGNLPPPPPRGSFASPPPNNQQGYAGPPRPSVGQAPMAGNGIGMNQQQPGPGGGFQSRPPPPAGPPGARGPGPNQQQQQSGPYGPVPGQQGPPQNQQQQFRPPPPQQQQNQQQPPPPPRNAQPSPAPGPYGPNPNVGGGGAPPLPGQGQVQGQGRGMPPQGGMSLPTQPPPRIGTPGAGAGAPVRSATPSKPASKYPPGDRSHIPEAQKPIFNCLSRELARLKSTAPPGQKRMVEDTERRLNILFDALNCGTVDEKLLGGLSQLVGAVDARNQQAALSIHLQLASSASGELGAAMVGIKMIISRMQQ